jgi:hypothetical protein
LITAHPDVSVQAPHREHDVVLPEGAVPAKSVLIVGVDERAVDVENGSPTYEAVASACTEAL